MMLKNWKLITLFSLVVGPSVLHAHGPQMQITGEFGAIVTRSILMEQPYSTQRTSPKSAYVMPLLAYQGAYYTRPNIEPDPLDPGLPHYYSGPGFAYGLDQASMGSDRDFSAGSTLSLQFIEGFSRWDGMQFVDAGAVELEAFRGSETTRTTDGAASVPLPFASVAADYAADVHATVRYRLLGDGHDPLTPAPDGVYLAQLVLSSSDAAMQDSDPFYFVLHKNGTAGDILAAVDSLGVAPARIQFVPEPISGIAACALLLCLGRLRRRMALSRG